MPVMSANGRIRGLGSQESRVNVMGFTAGAVRESCPWQHPPAATSCQPFPDPAPQVTTPAQMLRIFSTLARDGIRGSRGIGRARRGMPGCVGQRRGMQLWKRSSRSERFFSTIRRPIRRGTHSVIRSRYSTSFSFHALVCPCSALSPFFEGSTTPSPSWCVSAVQPNW